MPCSGVQKSLSWPLPADLDDSRLEAMLYRQSAARTQYAQPDYARMHQELKRKGVTLQLLWEEYAAAHGERAARAGGQYVMVRTTDSMIEGFFKGGHVAARVQLPERPAHDARGEHLKRDEVELISQWENQENLD